MSLKNWDNKTWLSSTSYIRSFNNFLLKQIKLNKNSRILDIGCGRGKILGNLSSRLRLKKKPIGLDIENHNDRDKRIEFKKVNAIKFLKNDKKEFDLILIKQSIHFFKFLEIKKLLKYSKNKLKPGGKIIIFTLDTIHNEIPTFSLMKDRLKRSLERDKKLLKFIVKLYPQNLIRKFSFQVTVTRKKYVNMIRNRYISILLNLNLDQILKGIDEINFKYKKSINFKDRLTCLILKK